MDPCVPNNNFMGVDLNQLETRTGSSDKPGFTRSGSKLGPELIWCCRTRHKAAEREACGGPIGLPGQERSREQSWQKDQERAGKLELFWF